MAAKSTDRTRLKAAWGPGPWQDEGDRKEFTHNGFPCLANRNPMGAWCGYVAVPPGHPWHGLDYDSVEADVHGGLTYAGKCHGEICHVPAPGEPDDVYWLGFDCGHEFDLLPELYAHYPLLPTRIGSRAVVYRDLAYVEAQIRSLADQAAAAALPPADENTED